MTRTSTVASTTHASEMRSRILDAAQRVMHNHGYRATTMPAIAAEADVSVGLLYRYFESKEELHLAMCEAITQAQLDELSVQLGGIHDTSERLAAGVRLFIEGLEAKDWGGIVVAGWAEAETNSRLRDLLQRRCDQLRSFVAMFIRESVARGEIDPAIDVEQVSLGVTMLLDGVLAHRTEVGRRFDPALAERAIIGLLAGVLRPVQPATLPPGQVPL
jgi:AcrR family transcriptional regulator